MFKLKSTKKDSISQKLEKSFEEMRKKFSTPDLTISQKILCLSPDARYTFISQLSCNEITTIITENSELYESLTFKEWSMIFNELESLPAEFPIKYFQAWANHEDTDSYPLKKYFIVWDDACAFLKLLNKERLASFIDSIMNEEHQSSEKEKFLNSLTISNKCDFIFLSILQDIKPETQCLILQEANSNIVRKILEKMTVDQKNQMCTLTPFGTLLPILEKDNFSILYTLKDPWKIFQKLNVEDLQSLYHSEFEREGAERDQFIQVCLNAGHNILATIYSKLDSFDQQLEFAAQICQVPTGFSTLYKSLTENEKLDLFSYVIIMKQEEFPKQDCNHIITALKELLEAKEKNELTVLDEMILDKLNK